MDKKKLEFKDESKDLMWRQFCNLGEMIGDGLHHEEAWISKEYNRLSKILVPPTPEEKEHYKKLRKLKADNINKQMSNLIQKFSCTGCGGKLEQRRSGTKVAYCTECNIRFVAKCKKKC